MSDLDDLIRRVDPDRWLSSRFIADPAKRADVIALYAFDHELARAPRVSANPLVGQMRLAFWHEVLDEIFEGRLVRAHPAARAVSAAVARHHLPRGPFQAMLDGRDRELDGAPLSAQEARALAASTAGEAARLAAGVLSPDQTPEQLPDQGARWALSRLLLTARVAQSEAPAVRRQLLARNRTAPIGPAVFPAVAHAVLVRPYAAGHRPSELEKRLRVSWAVARGRV